MASERHLYQKTLEFYFAYRRLKNFACAEVHPQTQTLLVYLDLDPDPVQIEDGFSRDVRGIGHYGNGDLELRIRNAADFAKAQPLIQQSYSTG
jgi:predicted transport protein